MDQFWRVLRIGCNSVFVVAGLGIASCTAINWIAEYPKNRMRQALMARGFEVLQRKHGNMTTIAVRDLFGADLDGICVVRGSLLNATAFQAASPVKFQNAISNIVKLKDPPTRDGNHWYEYIYAIKGGAVTQKYELVRGAHLGIGAAPENACYDAGAPASVEFYPDDKSLLIGFPSKL